MEAVAGGGAAAAGEPNGVVEGGAYGTDALGVVLGCYVNVSHILCSNKPCCLVASAKAANYFLKSEVH